MNPLNAETIENIYGNTLNKLHDMLTSNSKLFMFKFSRFSLAPFSSLRAFQFSSFINSLRQSVFTLQKNLYEHNWEIRLLEEKPRIAQNFRFLIKNEHICESIIEENRIENTTRNYLQDIAAQDK
uniref:Uncharacterized protein n=1 Tax=Romanomermis culicivorax TaxID=13658 RepID=A0A915IN53_ROMCU